MSRSRGPWEFQLGFRVQGSGFRVWGLGFRVDGLGCRVEGLGLRVWGFYSPITEKQMESKIDYAMETGGIQDNNYQGSIDHVA